MSTPLEKARQRIRDKTLYSCLECMKCVKVGGWWYCEESGKLLHPMMLERTGPMRCENAVLKEENQ